MDKFQVVFSLHFKKGMEHQGMQFVENKYAKKAIESGLQEFRAWQDINDPSHYIFTGHWNNKELLHKYQSQANWEAAQRELTQYCSQPPKKAIYKILDKAQGQQRRAA